MAAVGRGRRRVQTLLVVAILLVLTVLGGMLWYNRAIDELLPGIIESLPKNVDLGLDSVHYSQNEDGKRSWVLDADRAAYQRKEEELSLTAVEMTFFDAGTFGELKLNADTGLLRQKLNLIDLQGNVRIETETGERFQTESLQYDFVNQLATTDKQIHMRGRQLELTGNGMILDLSQGKMRVLNNVHALLEERSFKGVSQ